MYSDMTHFVDHPTLVGYISCAAQTSVIYPTRVRFTVLWEKNSGSGVFEI